MDYAEAVAFIFGFTNYELTPLSASPATALRLSRIRALLERLGNPQKAAKFVHVTGSKGKGSTACMISSLLQSAGMRTGLYTSPHLHTPGERIAIDGVPLAKEEFARLTTRLAIEAEAQNRAHPDGTLTTFELLTALAFLAFRERGCEWQVVEVGLGGTLDATNVLDEKVLCVFTPISLEHTAVLGPTTTAIAADKAGILRVGCRAVIAPQDPDAGGVLRDACGRLGVHFDCVDAACSWGTDRSDLDGQDCWVRTPHGEYAFRLPLLGAHQVENAATAIFAMENLAPGGVHLTPADVSAAFAAVRWPGRLEVLSRAPLVLVDGAHNAASAQRLAEALHELLPAPRARAMARAATPGAGPWTLVIGTLADKDLAGIVAALAPLAAEVIAVAPDHPRARPAVDVARAFDAAGVPTRLAGGVTAGVRAALSEAESEDAICIAGSLYAVAEARAELLGARV